LRLRASLALSSTAKMMTAAVARPEKRRAVGEALKGLRWVIRERRPVPAELNAAVRRLRW
jgi:hypothetical protein